LVTPPDDLPNNSENNKTASTTFSPLLPDKIPHRTADSPFTLPFRFDAHYPCGFVVHPAHHSTRNILVSENFTLVSSAEFLDSIESFRWMEK